MEEKCHIRRVVRARENISAGVATEGEVASCVHAVHSVREVALHDRLEPVDIRVLGEQRRRVGIRVPLRRDSLRNVTFQASGVVRRASAGRYDFWFRERWFHGTEVDNHAAKANVSV